MRNTNALLCMPYALLVDSESTIIVQNRIEHRVNVRVETVDVGKPVAI